MRIAVLSDIHGNLEAFREVLADIENVGVDLVVSLGDNVGYGPEPEAVVNLIRERKIPSVLGNHELALTDERYHSWFNLMALETILKTHDIVSENTLEFCKHLPSSLVMHDCLLVHGYPPNSVLRYLLEETDSTLMATLTDLKQTMCFVGHTHLLEVIRYNGNVLSRHSWLEPMFGLDPKSKYIVNVGSVGQPRDELSNRAKYVIYDQEKCELELRSVRYNIAGTAQKILDLGWPRFLASRLY